MGNLGKFTTCSLCKVAHVLSQVALGLVVLLMAWYVISLLELSKSISLHFAVALLLRCMWRWNSSKSNIPWKSCTARGNTERWSWQGRCFGQYPLSLSHHTYFSLFNHNSRIYRDNDCRRVHVQVNLIPALWGLMEAMLGDRLLRSISSKLSLAMTGARFRYRRNGPHIM